MREFEVLVEMAGAMPEEQLLGYFLGGLRLDLRSKVRINDPIELAKAIDLACNMEEDIWVLQAGVARVHA